MPKTPHILKGLNPNQEKAVTATEGPLLILAGAGSGKTRVLTHRIAYLVQELGVRPNSILAVTFTNKASLEMKQRAQKLLPKNILRNAEPAIATFHSFGLKILRNEAQHLGYDQDFVVYDSDDQKKIIKEVLKELDLSEKIYNINAICACISNAKNNFIFPKEFSQKASEHFEQNVALIYPLYQKLLEQNQAFDFDDLIVRVVQLFEKTKKVLKKYQNAYHYFMIDEYQDTNHSQYRLTNLLASSSRNLCVVGDDDQSIYSWRGADIRNILEFESDYPEAVVIKLEQNYRSTKKILEAAGKVICLNNQRKSKKLWTENAMGESIRFYEAFNELDEARFVAKKILDLTYKKNAIDYQDIAVMYRTNAQSRVLEETFIKEGLPYQLIGGIKFYERREIKDLLSYLRFISNPFDRLSFSRIVNLPARGIGKKALEKFFIFHNQRLSTSLLESLKNAREIPDLPKTALSGLENFYKLISEFKQKSSQMALVDLFDLILEKTGFAAHLQDGSEEGKERFENIMGLRNLILEYSEINPVLALAKFLEDTALMTDVDKMKNKTNQVTLITFHAVKGLEFPVVFMTGMEEGLFPHIRSFDSENKLEEERRLCYVGITRAKNFLFFTRAKERTIYGTSQPTIPSRYILNIPSELLINLNHKSCLTQKSSLPKKKLKITNNNKYYQEGDRVKHKSFGIGIVVQAKGDEVSVAFEGVGIKKLVSSIAPLKKF